MIKKVADEKIKKKFHEAEVKKRIGSTKGPSSKGGVRKGLNKFASKNSRD